MSVYVLLMRDHSEGLKAMKATGPAAVQGVVEALERWEVKILMGYRMLGRWDQCYIIEAPDNFKAYRATLAQEMSTTVDTEILPAIDLPLFERLIRQSAQTAGPHSWQISWWARAARFAMYPYAYQRWAWKFFTEHAVYGKKKWGSVRAPCIIISNHQSHFDQFCLLKAIPPRIRTNLFFGAAADRWFLKGRREITLQPWYQSLVMGLYPIQRGGGSRTLEYPKWLLDQGANLMLFPEGTRARGRHLSHFKHGVSILALEKNVPVVPVYLEGVKRIRPPGTKEAIPGPVAAHVLDPIRFDPGTSVPEATERLYTAMKDVHGRILQAEGGSQTRSHSPS